jgi:hypothetical protein
LFAAPSARFSLAFERKLRVRRRQREPQSWASRALPSFHPPVNLEPRRVDWRRPESFCELGCGAAAPEGSVERGQDVTAVGAERQRLDAVDGADRQRCVEVWEQVTTSRWLPTQRRAEHRHVHPQQQ